MHNSRAKSILNCHIPKHPASTIFNAPPEHSLEGLLLKLKLQCLGHLMRRADKLEKTLVLGKTEDKRRWVTEGKVVG